tara:strand:+ start:3003 stop:4043 length:1041 start_codon:yes stop_codon:yes gene_type:complete
MLKFDVKNKKLEVLEKSNLTKESILERFGLQQAIYNCWSDIKHEINLENSYLIGQEITPHSSNKDSLDLLAFDANDNSLVVIELKRKKDKLQLLQAITYAGMVSHWGKERVLNEINSYKCNLTKNEKEELRDLVENTEINKQIKIVLIAEYYDPEVILTSEWLSELYGVNITAFAISLNKLNEKYFLSIEQRFPLKGLEDMYVERGKKNIINKSKEEVTWDSRLKKFKYSFAEEAIKLCAKEGKAGSPEYGRIRGVRRNIHGFAWVQFNFNYEYLLLYIKVNSGYDKGEGIVDSEDRKPSNARQFLEKKFPKSKINSWRDGESVEIRTVKEFDRLVKWLGLGVNKS